eukprot:TRINITY_DN74737_c0_g1_i1.p1 TRINITY_DN74737_c0_g1~~TRINITY_DN74737_c0_g1_i1.p1  ORF type:complete len:811 (-),score=163.85 TRINITY_DN74737_c0_g1_i1:352-2784(-)
MPPAPKTQQKQAPVAAAAAGAASSGGPSQRQPQTQQQQPSVSSLGDLYSKCVQLVNENKISTKNAFELQLIEHMDDIVDSFMGGQKRKQHSADADASKPKRPRVSRESATDSFEEEENRFHEASCTIEASARIYAVRVDCVHTDTYRVLGGLNSADVDEDDGKDGEDGAKASRKRRIVGVNTLEKNANNIEQRNIEADEQSDPMFRRMAAAFDAGGAKGLLLTHLPLAEDLSLVFNGDVSVQRAAAEAKQMFSARRQFSTNDIGVGDAAAVSARLTDTRLCPEVDAFRRELYGNVSMDVVLPPALDALLAAPGVHRRVETLGRAPAPSAPLAPIQDGTTEGIDDFPMDDMGGDVAGPSPFQETEFMDDVGAGQPAFPQHAGSVVNQPPLPLMDDPLPNPETIKPSEEAIAFEELFDKFCGGGDAHQFADFDESWSKTPAREKAPPAPVGAALDDARSVNEVAADPSDRAGQGVGGGVLVPASDVTRSRPAKRPLFDLSGLDRPVKPIEMEPAHKHQLSERAAQWQLHKDVPPYMIDRITMPSWPSWSKCDFACLALRPHLMLKLVHKQQPAGEGPHSFSDLLATVVVENPDAFPWMPTESRAGGLGRSFAADGDDDEGARGDLDGGLGNDAVDENFDENGLPKNLEVDPQELFLRPDDKVIPGCDKDDMAEPPEDDGGFEAGGFEAGADFDLVEQPTTVVGSDISYSRNSKFVDVKIVKKHLWDCISDDISCAATEVGEGEETKSSFQNLVNRTVSKMSKNDCENLSIQVCFICALHICNEKGVELKTDPSQMLGDFAVVGNSNNLASSK